MTGIVYIEMLSFDRSGSENGMAAAIDQVSDISRLLHLVIVAFLKTSVGSFI